MAPTTVAELLHFSYANLAMAHAAVEAKLEKYGRLQFMIRARLYAGPIKETMGIGPLAHDERFKMILPQACCYCGSRQQLSIDHLIPTKRGGPNTGDNLVWACRSCNSSKCACDAREWLANHSPTREQGDVGPLALWASAAFRSSGVGEKLKQALTTDLIRVGTTPLREQRDEQIQTEHYVFESGRSLDIVGVSCLYHPRWIGEHVLYIGWMFVRAEMHGLGLGQAILAETNRLVREKGCTTLMVETSQDPQAATALYQKSGCETVGIVPDYWVSGSDLAQLERKRNLPRL